MRDPTKIAGEQTNAGLLRELVHLPNEFSLYFIALSSLNAQAA
jgi:hypothetical protein